MYNPLALEQFLEAHNGNVLIRATPKGPRPDPYVVGGVLLIALIELAGQRVDHSALAPGLGRQRTAAGFAATVSVSEASL